MKIMMALSADIKQAKVETKRPLYPLKLLTRELRAKKKFSGKLITFTKRYLFHALDILDL
jgi:hypothetical protein